jgi:hypothetical protein
MNEKDFEKLAELLKANEQKLDNLLKKRGETETVSETKKEAEKDNLSEIDIKKVIDQLDI